MGPQSIHGSSRGSARIKAAEHEMINSDKAIVNLLREHGNLKRRLEEVQNPEFLISLKRQLKETEEEIQRQQKLSKQINVEQIQRDKRLDKISVKNEPETMK